MKQDRQQPVPVPSVLTTAPGFVARLLYQDYVTCWNRVVDPVLTGPQYAVLLVLKEEPGTDQASVAKAARLDASTMVDLCRRLERRHLIVRTTSLTDGRRKLLQLTSLGEDVLAEAQRRSAALNLRLVEALGDRGPELLEALALVGQGWRELATQLLDDSELQPVEDLVSRPVRSRRSPGPADSRREA